MFSSTTDTIYPFLSVLAVSLSGYARLHEKLGGPEASRAADRCLEQIENFIEARAGQGRIVRGGGREMLIAFDASDAAVNAAVEMQKLIAGLPPVSGAKMAIRVGISCGPLSDPDLPADNELVRETARLMGLARSGQILVSGKIRQALPEAMQKRVTPTGLTLPPDESASNDAVMEIIVDEASAAHWPEAVSGAPDASLRLRYGQDTVVLDEQRPVIVMGRDKTCEIVVRNPRASRRHATIERRGSLIVLIDQSSNGTFVTIDGHSPQFVKHGECPLQGSGTIAFSSSSSESDCVRFERVSS